MTATIRRTRRDYEPAKDPERHQLRFAAGLGLPALTVEDWTRCPRRSQARSHWTGPTTCRCHEKGTPA